MSCSKEETEASEWDNWQQRNEEYLNKVVSSWQAGSSSDWKRLKVYSKDPSVEGSIDEYVYVQVMEKGTGTESPLYTDSVRVVYQGRLMPTTNYAEGYIFDGTVYGKFNVATSSTARQLVSSNIDGYATALQHMHRGDYWRIYIPYQLGYGTSDKTSSSGAVVVPAYSVLIFDLQLVDFSHAGEVMPTWSARQR